MTKRSFVEFFEEWLETQNFKGFLRDFVEEQKALVDSKGSEYARIEGESDDQLANFYEIAEDVAIDPLKVWYAYFKKHTQAIAHFIRTRNEGSESMRGRFLDAANYLVLGAAILEDLESREWEEVEV